MTSPRNFKIKVTVSIDNRVFVLQEQSPDGVKIDRFNEHGAILSSMCVEKKCVEGLIEALQFFKLT
jgi:hypothetical protein